MANQITEQRIIDNNKRALLKYVATIDTAAANNLLVNVSTLRFALNANSQISSVVDTDQKNLYRTTVKRVFGTAKANAYYRLIWQGANTADIVTIGDGSFDYDFQSMGDGAIISNPDVNSNGDILLTIVTPSSADMLTLFIDLRKDNRDYDAGQTADPVAFNRGRAAGF